MEAGTLWCDASGGGFCFWGCAVVADETLGGDWPPFLADS